jgi:hypothetical protein
VTRDLFRQRPVEIRESCLLLNKMGTAALRSLLVYDAWWRLLRNLGIIKKEDIEQAGYAGPVPEVIVSMIGWQHKLPMQLLKSGPISKSIMFLHYLLHRNKIY